MNVVFIHDLINFISYAVPVGHGRSADNWIAYVPVGVPSEITECRYSHRKSSMNKTNNILE